MQVAIPNAANLIGGPAALPNRNLEMIGRVEGAIRSQVNDGPMTVYEAGQSFSELPGDRHAVSANASETKPAKLLAVFVVDTNETELTTPLGN